MENPQNLNSRVIEVEKWVAQHDALCANRYWWILAWVKITVAIIGISTCALIVGMWQIILHLEKM